MSFRPCPSGCGRFLSADEGHDRSLQCLGAIHVGLSGLSRGSPADTLGDLRVTVRASPPGTSPRTSYSSRSEHPIWFPGDFAGPSHGAPSISFGAPSVDRMSIAASGDGFTSSADEGAVGLPPSGVVATAAPDLELTAMLVWAAVSIGLEVNRPPSPEPSRLDDCFFGAGRCSQPRSTPVPFFLEVHEELTKSWMAPFTARSRSSASSILTTLDGGVARGYAGIPQVERAIAVHLCPRNAATWRNRPRLPSKACKPTAALVAKAYSAAGQAASALHAMAILQVHQAKALKQVHEGSTDPGLMQELRTVTDFALRVTKVMARSLGKAMSTMEVQERHLWLNLAEMKDADKARFLDAPISQAGLFGDTVEGFAQQFSAVQHQTEAIQHILPRRDAPSTAAPGARSQSARRRGRPPASSRAAPPQAESTHRLARLASRRRAIDLKDAYFHVSILPRHRPFLWFAFEGRAWQYRVLPFGLSLSPRVFTKVVEGALTPLREVGVRILNYLDDWLILAQSREQLGDHRDHSGTSASWGFGSAGKRVSYPLCRESLFSVWS